MRGIEDHHTCREHHNHRGADTDDRGADDPAPVASADERAGLTGGPPPDRLNDATAPLRGSFAGSYPDPGIVELDAKPLVQTNR